MPGYENYVPKAMLLLTRAALKRRTQDGASPVSTRMLLLVSSPLHRCWRFRGRWRRWRRGRGHGLDPHGRDAMAVHFIDYKVPPLVIERLAAFGHLLQP